MNEVKQKTKVDKFKEISNKLSSTYEAKNKDYGDSFGKSFDKYGPIAALTRISDKFNRIENLILKSEKGEGTPEVKESVQDTLIDLAAYSIMTLIELE